MQCLMQGTTAAHCASTAAQTANNLTQAGAYCVLQDHLFLLVQCVYPVIDWKATLGCSAVGHLRVVDCL